MTPTTPAATVPSPAPGEPPPAAAVLQILTGAWLAHAVAHLARLGIADHVGAGTRTVEEIARAAGVKADPLRRVLRAAASAGVFRLAPGDRVEQTPRPETLRRDFHGSPAWYGAFLAHKCHRDAWTALGHSIETGAPAFDHVHGANFFDHCAKHPDLARVFDEAMTGLSAAEQAVSADGFDFSGLRTIVDVGGGHGGLLSAILVRAPGARGVLFDQPHVVAGAGPTLAARGAADRITLVGGSFFATVPSGGDAYVLGHIVHDWDDARALKILRAVRAAARPGAKLLLFECVLPDDDRPGLAPLLDLEMLVMTPGGRERTEAEYAALVAQAGFRHVRVHPTRCETQIVESVAV